MLGLRTIPLIVIGMLSIWLSAASAAPTNLPDSAAKIPGVVINYSPAETNVYLGSPSIAILPNGDYLVSHDHFGTSATNQLTSIFRSSDRGQTWRHLTDINGQWWSGLFVHQGKLYIMGVRNWLGDVVIRRSDDNGQTWTSPDDGRSGLLLHGRYHTSAVPVILSNGRLWRAMEWGDGKAWELRTVGAFIMSAPVDADLLTAANWTSTSMLTSPPGFNNWREGNVVATPEGGIIDIIRVHVGDDKASVLRLAADGKTLSYDPEKDLIDFPGGATKYSIRFDPETKRYWALVNKQKNPSAGRNLIALSSSTDLRHWQADRVLLQHPDRQSHAFQYVDWQFEGDDIIAVSRTALDGAHNAHDSNYITFHRFKNFRSQNQ